MPERSLRLVVEDLEPVAVAVADGCVRDLRADAVPDGEPVVLGFDVADDDCERKVVRVARGLRESKLLPVGVLETVDVAEAVAEPVISDDLVIEPERVPTDADRRAEALALAERDAVDEPEAVVDTDAETDSALDDVAEPVR